MLPKSFTAFLFSLILSGLMSFMVSGITTLRTIGMGDVFFSSWIAAWLTAWLFAFPTVMLVTPITRKIVQLLIIKDPSSAN